MFSILPLFILCASRWFLFIFYYWILHRLAHSVLYFSKIHLLKPVCVLHWYPAFSFSDITDWHNQKGDS